jgi:hypothetical protein
VGSQPTIPAALEMTDLPETVWSGTFRLFGVTLRCHALDDGRRLVDAEDLVRLFSERSPARMTRLDRDELTRFAKWQRGES